MRLTLLLLRKKMPNGNIFTGKHRLVKKVTLASMTKLRSEYEQEEQNMFYLKYPYLTPEQSSGHSKALGKKENLHKIWTENRQLAFRDHVKIIDRLAHLKVRESWD